MNFFCFFIYLYEYNKKKTSKIIIEYLYNKMNNYLESLYLCKNRVLFLFYINGRRKDFLLSSLLFFFLLFLFFCYFYNCGTFPSSIFVVVVVAVFVVVVVVVVLVLVVLVLILGVVVRLDLIEGGFVN